jgi:hypothetical protein
VSAILKLIEETESWRRFHKARNAHIEAAACAVRIKALRDALDAVENSDGKRG